MVLAEAGQASITNPPVAPQPVIDATSVCGVMFIVLVVDRPVRVLIVLAMVQVLAAIAVVLIVNVAFGIPPQPKPVPEVQIKLLVTLEQEGIAKPEGVVAVNDPRTVLADCEARLALGRLPVTSVAKATAL